MAATATRSSRRRSSRSRSRSAPAPLTPSDLTLSAKTREHFGEEVIGTVLALIPEGANPPKAIVQRFFELACSYDLNPMTGEIWLAPERGLNASVGEWAVFVGRDGYLKEARRHDDFIACQGYPVYAGDAYEAMPDAEGNVIVTHEMVHPKDRGELIGAYARIFRRGAPTALFYADLGQYKKEGGTWTYEDAMIMKCAASYLLRTTYGVSGPVPFDEVSVGFDPERGVIATSEGETAVVLPPSVKGLYDLVREQDPRAFSLAELQARTRGATDEQLGVVERELQGWLDEREESAAASLPLAIWTDRLDDEARETVRILVKRRDELAKATGDTEQQTADIEAELTSVREKLEANGLPADWMPPPEQKRRSRGRKSS